MRPKTIVYFERIMFGTLLLSVLRSYLSWGRFVAHATTVALLLKLDPNSSLAVAFTAILPFVLIGTLTLLASRRRSKIAMWVAIALFALNLPGFVQRMIHGEVIGPNIIAVLQGIAQGVAFGLLFTPSARRWMRSRKNEKLLQVFD